MFSKKSRGLRDAMIVSDIAKRLSEARTAGMVLTKEQFDAVVLDLFDSDLYGIVVYDEDTREVFFLERELDTGNLAMFMVDEVVDGALVRMAGNGAGLLFYDVETEALMFAYNAETGRLCGFTDHLFE